MDDARESLIEDQLDLVAEIAQQYSGRGVPLRDLIHSGNLGLIKAAEVYRLDGDGRSQEAFYEFRWFASWHIRQEINRLFHGYPPPR